MIVLESSKEAGRDCEGRRNRTWRIGEQILEFDREEDNQGDSMVLSWGLWEKGAATVAVLSQKMNSGVGDDLRRQDFKFRY